jgi:hypothetical protein
MTATSPQRSLLLHAAPAQCPEIAASAYKPSLLRGRKTVVDTQRGEHSKDKSRVGGSCCISIGRFHFLPSD